MEAHESQCQTTRALIGKLEAEPASEQATSAECRDKIESHLAQCTACVSWRQESSDLVAAASVLPQFDVPEALTQRILTAVAAEQQSVEGRSTTLLFVLLTVVACLVLFYFESFESMEGALAWGVGLAAMALIRLLVGKPQHVLRTR